MYGAHEFNEVTFDDVFVPEDMTVGGEGQGWAMVTSELAFERSGPDRFLSTFPLLVEAFREARAAIRIRPLPPRSDGWWRIWRRCAACRRRSPGLLQKGESPATQAALVKDLGTTFEQEIPEVVRRMLPLEPRFTQRR